MNEIENEEPAERITLEELDEAVEELGIMLRAIAEEIRRMKEAE